VRHQELERLDTRTPGQAGRGNPSVDAAAQVDRPENVGPEGDRKP
jgi:hypothetical protein